VAGHEGIVVNETDQLARMGSEHPFIGPEPACSLTDVQESGQGMEENKSQITL
jgi:hypothetical protein